MNTKQLIAGLAVVFQSVDKQVHDKEDIQKLRDAGKSEEFIAGCRAMFHAISTMIDPLMRRAMIEAVMDDMVKLKQSSDTVKAMEKAEATETDEINPEIKSFLERFKGPMQ